MPLDMIKVKRSGAMKVAYFTKRGPYYEIPSATRQLFKWMNKKGYRQNGLPIIVYLNRPDQVSPDNLVTEIWCPVAPDTPELAADEEGMGIKYVAAQEVAATTYKGRFTPVKSEYAIFEKWLKENGYTAAGPWQEAYLPADGKSTAEVLTEIRVPVKKR